MHITWFSWKDISHPEAGGAERVSDEIRKRLVEDGHHVTLITALYNNAATNEKVEGVTIIRIGGRYSVYLQARSVYKKLPPQDLVIDEMNTIPFAASFYRGEATPVLLTYQLTRKVWFYQMPFPFSVIGYLLEPLYLRLLSRAYPLILTESNSTKEDLVRFGFKRQSIEVFRVGMETNRPTKLPKEPTSDTVIFLGALRPMKRPIDAIKAFELARDTRPTLKLVVAGNDRGDYAQKVLSYIKQSRHRDAIDMRGRITEEEKDALLTAARVILVTSIKEGWGLIVTEANSHGTPAIVYDTDGLRDSVQNQETGLTVTSGNPRSMSEALLKLLEDPKKLQALRTNAFEHSKQFNYPQSYKDFDGFIQKLLSSRS